MSRRPASGFTLIELVVAVAIVAVLATMALPLSEVMMQRGKEQELRLALREIRLAIDAYKQAVEDGRIGRSPTRSGYPETLQALVDGVADAANPEAKKKRYFLRRVPRDPLHPDPSVPAEDTWGLRSYDSSHDQPEPGDDVFDVYSLAPGVGLDGIPYREW